ncbi:MAG: Ig-like domain-containing protein [Microgenomates group bacterium]
MKKFLLLFLIIIILIFSLGGLVLVISQRTTFFGRAYTPRSEGVISLENSYLFASPLQAQAGGEEKIRVTVFILDNTGRGLANQPVFLGNNEQSLVIVPIQGTTDELGRAIFDVSAQQPGEYLIEGQVRGKILPQRVKVIFR